MIDPAAYPVIVFPAPDDSEGGFIAIAPDFPGSSAWGATQAAAIAELQTCIEGWIEAYREDARRIPEPTPYHIADQWGARSVARPLS